MNQAFEVVDCCRFALLHFHNDRNDMHRVAEGTYFNLWESNYRAKRNLTFNYADSPI